MLDVDVQEAEVVVLEGALSLGGAVGNDLGPAVQPFGLQDAENAVAVEVRQEVAHHESEVVEREVGGPSQGADHGALLLTRLPGQPVRTGRAVQAVGGAAFAPLADGLGADAVAACDGAAGLGGSCDLGADGGRGAGIRVDVEHDTISVAARRGAGARSNRRSLQSPRLPRSNNALQPNS